MPAFLIDGRSYEVPTTFRLADTVLVAELTGLDFEEFGERLEEDSAGLIGMIGMIGVAVWQANPKWSRSKVRSFVEQIDIDSVNFEGVDAAGGDDGPPSQAGEESPSLASSDESTITPVDLPDGAPV